MAVEKVAEWAKEVIEGNVKVAVTRTDLVTASKSTKESGDWDNVAPSLRSGWASRNRSNNGW
jgi:hypothetical protein